jgi:hypothetical protein
MYGFDSCFFVSVAMFRISLVSVILRTTQMIFASFAHSRRNMMSYASGEDNLLDRGRAVRVRCASGETRENLVWEDFGAVVMVCAREQYERLIKGYSAPMPIGFRRADVFAGE